MKLIRKRCYEYALMFAASISLAMWLGMAFMVEAVFAFGLISVISFILLVRQSRLLYDARLIWDNRILSVPSVLMSMPDCKIKKDTWDTVVSTFGILIGNEIFRWGLDGLHGAKLLTVQIDTKRMYLTFGTVTQTMEVELLHGITEKQELEDIVKKLFYETGVSAVIYDQ